MQRYVAVQDTYICEGHRQEMLCLTVHRASARMHLPRVRACTYRTAAAAAHNHAMHADKHTHISQSRVTLTDPRARTRA